MVFRKLLLALVVVLCLNLSIVVFAHPGGTDSYGGHTNSGTGEYHYHHGYSAHQHYDMDGDGDWDCPYLFVDKTDSSVEENKNRAIKNYFIPVILCLALPGVVWAIDEIKWRFRK